MNANRRVIARPCQAKEDFVLEYVLKYIRNRYRHNITDQDVLNILTKEFKSALEDKLHFEVGMYMQVTRNSILEYPHWNSIRRMTNSCFRQDYRFNRNVKEFSNSLKMDIYKRMSSIQLDLTPNLLQINKNSCVLFNMQDVAAALPDAATSLPFTPASAGAVPSDAKALPVKTDAGQITLKCVMNWPNVLVSLSLPGFQCMRQNLREVTYDMINVKNMAGGLIAPVPFTTQQTFHGERDFHEMGVDKNLVNQCLQRQKMLIEKKMTINDKQIKDLDTIFNEFIFNLENGPALVKPGEYKIILNQYNYFRIMPEEVPEGNVSANMKDKHDIRMEEIIAPAQIISFSYVLVNEMNKNYMFKNEMPWLKIHCLCCRKSFEFTDLSFEKVLFHFKDYHYDEPLEWNCSNCKQTFPAKYLMECGWRHHCQNMSNTEFARYNKKVGEQ